MNIWEEKNSIEQEKNSSNYNVLDQNDITNVTKHNSMTTKCGDIGKDWERNCPDCLVKLTYSSKYKLIRAIKANSKCAKCCNKNPPDNNVYFRPCPQCNKRIYYVKKCRFVAAEKNKTNCKSCAMSISGLGRVPTDLARKSMSAAQMGRKHSEKTKKKMMGKNNGMFGIFRCEKQNPFHGKTHSEETRKRMRISALKRISEIGGVNVGKKENDYFASLEKETGWDGVFHGKSGHQFVLWELGYSVDYYEPTKNIVVEYDEPRHYRCGALLEKDVKRMNTIKNHLRCKFFRYREKTGELSEY